MKKWVAANHRLVQRNTQSKQITPSIDVGFQVSNLLCRRITQGCLAPYVSSRRQRSKGQVPGNAEIDQPEIPAGITNDVLGLYVPVNDLGGLCVNQGLQHMEPEAQELVRWQCAGVKQCSDVLANDPLLSQPDTISYRSSDLALVIDERYARRLNLQNGQNLALSGLHILVGSDQLQYNVAVACMCG